MIDVRIDICFDFILSKRETSIFRDKITASSTVLFWIQLLMADLIVAEMVKQARRFFTCEFKLKVAECYNNNEKTILHTANKFKIERKQVRN